MKRNVTHWSIVASAVLVLATAPIASAQKITEQRLQELIREAAARAGVPQIGAPTATPQTAGAAGQPVVHLSLDDAIKLALDRNLDISVQRLNPQTFDFSIAAI